MSIKKTLESLVLMSALLTNSCNVLVQVAENEKSTKLREQGYDPYHAEACGAHSVKSISRKNKDIHNERRS